VGYGLGIDVGTTYTAAATWRDGRAEAATLGDQSTAMPSTVFLREDGEVLVGAAAERRAATDPTRVARHYKRRLGDTRAPLVLGGRAVGPVTLMAAVIRWVADRVTAREGGPPDHIVLTHPAGWGGHLRALLAEAAAEAGVGGAALIPEPVAAAVHYRSTDQAAARVSPGATLAVYDLGGGTFDATLLRATGDGFEVVGTPVGHDHLGGLDFDALVWDHVLAGLPVDATSLGDDPPLEVVRALARARAAAVDAKEALSYDAQAVVPVALPGVLADVRLTRAEFEELVRPALAETVTLLRQAASGVGDPSADLRGVLLVGGSSRIPLVSQLVHHGLRVPVTVDAHPKLATCLGAARLTAAPPASRPSRPAAEEPAPARRPAAPAGESSPAPAPRPAAPAGASSPAPAPAQGPAVGMGPGTAPAPTAPEVAAGPAPALRSDPSDPSDRSDPSDLAVAAATAPPGRPVRAASRPGIAPRRAAPGPAMRTVPPEPAGDQPRAGRATTDTVTVRLGPDGGQVGVWRRALAVAAFVALIAAVAAALALRPTGGDDGDGGDDHGRPPAGQDASGG
jgi:actin-like ATPase involved in cell morphogenesis